MGMSFENNNLTPAEQKELEMREKALAAASAKEPTYTSLGSIQINGKPVLLLVGADKKWYKAPFVRDYQFSPTRNSPVIPEFDTTKITPITEDEFYSYFQRS